MKDLSCKNCAGTMVLDPSAMRAFCPFCGAEYVLNHEDTDYYNNFFAQMCAFLSMPKDDQLRTRKADALWEKASSKSFITDEGVELDVRYMHKYSVKNADVYVARKNIIYHFKNNGMALSELFRKNVSFIDYPSADTRSLSDFFPKVSGGFVLDDKSHILVLEKDENEYPLRVFGKLDGRHIAWIVSRMENLCCVLEYNGMVHPEINLDTLYINPYTHQACLYGNWWNVVKNNSFSPETKKIYTTKDNLTGLRNVAANLFGFASALAVDRTCDAPAPFVKFITGAPCDNAYEDFGLWDDVLIKSYGERKFINFETDDEQLYGKKR